MNFTGGHFEERTPRSASRHSPLSAFVIDSSYSGATPSKTIRLVSDATTPESDYHRSTRSSKARLGMALARMKAMEQVLRRKWHELLRSWKVEPTLADKTLEELCRYYAEPGRFYHTLAHIQYMLETVEGIG